MGRETAGLGTGSPEQADETKPSAIATSNERAREQRAANLPGRMGSSEWSVSGEQVSAANPMRTRERDMMGPPSPATPLASAPHPPAATLIPILRQCRPSERTKTASHSQRRGHHHVG